MIDKRSRAIAMSPTRAVSNTLLGICLEGGQTEYAPGDTIIGSVFRSDQLVSQFSSLSIQLIGRSSSKIAILSENGLERYYSGFNLIPRHAKQKLSSGPLHITDGDEKSWRFTIKIPKYVDPADFNTVNPGESYLPLNATNNPMPSTFTLFGADETKAFVEYFIRASLRSKNDDCVDTWVAKLPVTVTNHSPLVSFSLRTMTYSYSVTSYRLLPRIESKLSLPHRVKQAMATSSVPRFGFNLLVDMPEVIQLNDPRPIPIRLGAIMDRQRTSDAVEAKLPKIKLRWISVQIIAVTEVICKGPHMMGEELETDLDIMSQIPARGQDVCIPCTEDGSFIDIGDLINLRLDRYYNFCPQHQGSAPFSPSFVTYNVRLSHRLKWTLVVEVAGQRFEKSEILMLKIFGPSRQGLDEPIPVSWSQSSDDDGVDWAQEEGFVTGSTPRVD